MANIFVHAIITAMLLACSVQDFRKKKIFLWMIILGAILIGICVPFCNTLSILERLGGIAIGVVVAVISIATAGKIGMGDGLLLSVTGLGLGFWGNLELFAIALLLAAIISIILLILRIVDRKKSIPFVPFLLMGYLFVFIVDK